MEMHAKLLETCWMFATGLCTKADLKTHMHQVQGQYNKPKDFWTELAAMQDERMQSMMEDMRGKFKAVAAILGVLDDYFPSQKSSAAESLAF